jgi:hypothetical protein
VGSTPLVAALPLAQLAAIALALALAEAAWVVVETTADAAVQLWAARVATVAAPLSASAEDSAPLEVESDATAALLSASAEDAAPPLEVATGASARPRVAATDVAAAVALPLAAATAAVE